MNVQLLPETTKKLQKPKPWKHPHSITVEQLKQIREEFWDTAPHYGGQRGACLMIATFTLIYLLIVLTFCYEILFELCLNVFSEFMHVSL